VIDDIIHYKKINQTYSDKKNKLENLSSNWENLMIELENQEK
jgi:hypothetical protein